MIADFDLTGQLVWPGAMLLNNYLSANPEMLRGRSVIELGSGVGKNLFELQSLPFYISNLHAVVIQCIISLF